MKDSIACVRASRPESLVGSDGRLRVRHGSRSATAGTIYGLKIPSYTFLTGSLKTATSVISAAVPEVVGMQITGADGFFTFPQLAGPR